MDQVRVLDGFNRVRFGKDPELRSEWEAVRGVPGRSRHALAGRRLTLEVQPSRATSPPPHDGGRRGDFS